MYAYVINLARSPERRAHISAELRKARIGYEIVEAVEGRELDLHDHRTVEPSVLTRSWFQPGAVGCALSHLRVYRKILADGLDLALVLEDDVTLTADLSNVVQALADHLVGAEVALLNFDSVDPCKLSRGDSVCLPSSRLLIPPIDVDQPRSAAAYLITRKACQRMDESRLPIRAQSDDWGFFYREGVLDGVRCVVPLTVVKNPRFRSTKLGGVKVALDKVPLFHQAISYRRQRFLRRQTRTEFVDKPFIERTSRLE